MASIAPSKPGVIPDAPKPKPAPTLLPGQAIAQYNGDLAKKFGLPDAIYPAVTKQLEVVPFNRRSLKPFGYNPSICRFGDRILMAYRYHGQGWATRLAMAELDASFKVLKHKDIRFDGGDSHEDPHLFIHDNALWLSWVESTGPTGNWTCVIKYGKLAEGKDAWSVPQPFQPKVGKNDGTGREKNWVFFSVGHEIHLLYSQHPKRICYAVLENLVTRPTSEGDVEHFPWGTPKGGTTAMPFKDGTIRFWHSTLDNEANPHAVNNYARRYFIGAFYAKERGFQCKHPILYGSEATDLTPTEISSCKHYKSNVVYCSGAIAMPDGSYVLSVGINDSEVALLRVTEKDFRL